MSGCKLKNPSTPVYPTPTQAVNFENGCRQWDQWLNVGHDGFVDGLQVMSSKVEPYSEATDVDEHNIGRSVIIGGHNLE